MLNCEYCDYFENVIGVSSGSEIENVSLCKFSSYVFAADETKSDMEYPCKDISYQDYLNKNKVRKAISIMKGDDWKVIYKKRHLLPERKRSLKAM